jgi:hypothetical protein
MPLVIASTPEQIRLACAPNTAATISFAASQSNACNTGV